jgi:WD40 repeat protein
MKGSSYKILVLAVISVAAGCAVPLARRQIDHVIAIGWTPENHPVALAQEIELNKHFWIVTPEGAMETNQTISHGRLVLLSDGSRTRVKLRFDDGRRGDFELVDARAIAGERRFAALVSRADTSLIFEDEYGFTIDFDGQAGQFYRSERYAEYVFTPDGSALCRLWNPPRESARVIESVDIATGEIRPLESLMLEVELAFNADRSGPDWLPCESDYRNTRSCLSPDGALLTFSCDNGDSCSIWLTRADLSTIRLATVQSFSPPATEGLDELEARYLYSFHTLAWSPDQSRLYFCQSPGASGYVINVSTGIMISHHPGFMAASWSPDGNSLAGVRGNRLTVWTPFEGVE